MRNFILSILSFILLSTTLSAQRTCAAEAVLAQQLLNNPAMQEEVENIRLHTQQFIQNGGAQDRTEVTIPVVVHVVYFNATQNISDAQIATQLDVLNADFRRLNADAVNTPAAWQGIAADCEVNFCMAQQDPNGNATNGIVRVSTSVNGFSANDNMKFASTGGSNIWDRNKYLNLWVCNLSGGLLGYAQFPGGSASTDGVVCDYAYFGTIGTATAPFDLGRTATHEVGHWLNCYHIWGDDGTSCTGTDQVADTPNQADENYGCPVFPAISCSNGPNGDMFMNYMDYTDDGCMNVFSNGQKTRMQALFSAGGARNALTSSNGCQPSGSSCGTTSGLNATNITQTGATLNWAAVSGATSYNLQWKLSTASTWTTVAGIAGTSQALTGLTSGATYNFQVQTVCGSSSSSYSVQASFTTLSGEGSCGVPSGLTATGITQTGATLNWVAVSGAISYNLQWKLSTASTWTTVNGIAATSQALTGLSASSTYKYKVQSVCSGSSSSYSTQASFTTLANSSCGVSSGLNATGITQTGATVNWTAVGGATSYTLQWKLSTAGSWATVSGITATSWPLTGLLPGAAYNFKVKTICGGTSSSYSAVASFTTLASSCVDLYEPNNSNSTAKVIPVNTDISMQIVSTSDKDYLKFANTATAKNIKVDLTTLPDDYDLKLYRGTSLLGISQHAGTTDEFIVYNTSVVASTYIAYVYGYQNAWSNTSCYTLRASLSSSAWRTDGSTEGLVEEVELPVVFENAGFGLYPNPASSIVTVAIPMENESEVSVTLFDLSGKVVAQQHRVLAKGDDQMVVDVKSLPNGVYFVQVSNGENTATRKLVVQQ
jgi:hypothetical protein